MGSYQWDSGQDDVRLLTAYAEPETTFGNRHFGLGAPTDAELVVHCFGSFFDERLSPVRITQGSPSSISTSLDLSHPFSSRHLVFEGRSWSNSTRLSSGWVLVRKMARPPHFVVLNSVGRMLSVSSGRQNAFHAILQLLMLFEEENDGFIGGLNLRDPSLDLRSVLDA
mmetsp:Transcript_11465/g.23273  ORF Transcript_11465/g.23273 Transcript_11465/m.23273 type:complete len:168 (-) Transcript_11465:716-1219(-)